MPNLSIITSSTIALAGAALLAGCGQAPASEAAAAPLQPQLKVAGASATHPVVVELFQSQGCSSCPPANANVNAIAGRPDVLALSFAVTYWDQLGWKDTFDSPKFTARQWDYANHAGRPQVATPQVILNGGPTIIGHDRRQLDAAMAKAGPARGGPAVSIAGATLNVAAQPGGKPSTVWLVRYDPKSREVAIRAGENNGRTLPHRNIVVDLVDLGSWQGKPSTFQLPAASEPGLLTAVLVQQGKGGPITSAAKV
uniref:DUF1223 domain-containing protein n=1 Tax=uncultured Sphingomonas sp. TaxID=158754 RepID=UPI0025D01606|nr:DUF1223 domain-containing protein [uncultured Sphingomonas sp.]